MQPIKKPLICISWYMHAIGLNDAESFHVGYLNYETLQKIVERRLSQKIVRNNSPFVTSFDCFGPSFRGGQVNSGFGTVWKQNTM